VASTSLPPPLTTRLRSRKVSNDVPPQSSSGVSHRQKGKGKHVGFDDKVKIVAPVPVPEPELSDLSELTESDADTVTTNPSPRRLRSQGPGKRRPDGEGPSSPLRTPPRRKVKEHAANDGDSGRTGSRDATDEDVDELDNEDIPSLTPTQPRRTPLKHRLRPRKLQTYTPPSDGDDERDGDEDAAAGGEGDDEDAEGETDDEEAGDDADEVTPRKLRSGKVVGDVDVVEDDELEDEGLVAEQEVLDEECDDAQEKMSIDGEIDIEESSEDDEDDGSDYDDSVDESAFVSACTGRSG
jgi:mitogen-activated protein kinase kinase kinase 13